MIAHPRRRNPTRIQATLWLLGSKKLHPRASQRFVSWLQNPRHFAAYKELVDLLALLLHLRRPPDATTEELHADTPESLSRFEGDLSPQLTVLQGGKQSGSPEITVPETGFRPRLVSSLPPAAMHEASHAARASRRGWPVLGGWGAACAIVVMVAIYWTGALSLLRGKVYMTGPGQQRLVRLADGSQITLGGASELRVRFSRDLRTIDLDRGEALFNVVHDSQRPFVVHAGAGTITDVGTEFLVRRYSQYFNRIQVWVTRGTVQVAPVRGLTLNAPSLLRSVSWRTVRLASGEQMSYTDRGSATPIKRSDPRPAMELTDGTFIYHGRPLGEVIEDVQRYTPQPITLDSQAARLMYSGSVLERDVRQWLRGLPQIFPGVQVTQESNRIAISYVPEAGSGDPSQVSGGSPD
ncbi:MAG TPA: FecR domain-containing protein [Steroidobacteraceae bacterium]|nr:FecR domain-containing protein [Steroidobacteraceae bacterium]